MKKKLFILLLSVISVVCLAAGLSACKVVDSESTNTGDSPDTSYSKSDKDDNTTDNTADNDDNQDDNSDNNDDDSSETVVASVGLDFLLSEDETCYILYGFGECTDTDVVIPSTYNGLPVAAIEDHAFFMSGFGHAAQLTSVTIPDSVIFIGDMAFDQCYSLEKIIVNKNNEYYKSVDGNLYSNDGTKLIRYPIGKTDTSFEIPEGVISIERYAFEFCYYLTNIIIPDSVTAIGEYAFCGCSDLSTIVIGNSVETIGDSAFYSCYSLTSVTIGNGVYSIGENAFSYCSMLSSITVDDGNKSYKSLDGNLYSYDGTELIQYSIGKADSSFEIINGVTSIGNNAFSSSVSLTSIIVPGSLMSIGSEAFSMCLISELYISDLNAWCSISFADALANPLSRGICNLYLGEELVTELVTEDLTVINSYSFYGYNSLISITIPEGIKSIGKFAFYNCVSLESVTLPNSLVSVGNYAFGECESLTNINIPKNVTFVGEYAFGGCSKLENVYIDDIATWCNLSFCDLFSNPLYYGGNLYLYNPDSEIYEVATSIILPESVSSIGVYAFYNCKSLTDINILGNIEFIDDYAFYNCSALVSVNVPDSVTYIGNYAFYNCSALVNINIPDKVTSIGEFAFYNCTALANITVESGNTNFKSINGNLYSYDGTELLLYTVGKPYKSFDIPDGVTKIGDYAFAFYKGTSIAIPDSVMSIGYYAFYNCKYLNAVYITDLEVWCNISFNSQYDNPLYYAGNLYLNGVLVTELVIPESVTSIGSYAFYNCYSLKNITISESVKSIGNYAFYNCTSLTEIKFEATDMDDLSENNYVFYKVGMNSEQVTVTIGKNVTRIPAYLFCSTYRYSGDNTYKIKNIIFEDVCSCEIIGENAFSNCASMINVYISDIGAWCNVVFESETANPLYNEGNLYVNGVLLTDLADTNITSIGDFAFVGWYVTDIVIPDSVVSVGSGAFMECAFLEKVTIGSGVTSISSFMFAYCSSLTNIIFGDNVISIGEYAFLSCSLLEDITISRGVTSIGNFAFQSCVALTSIVIPDSVIIIDDYAFSFCTGLTNITIGNGVTSIGNYAFWDCTSLKNIVLPESIVSIGKSAFLDTSIKCICYCGNENGWNSISFCDGYSNPLIYGAIVYYYSESEPDYADGYNYWHYINGKIIVWTQITEE